MLSMFETTYICEYVFSNMKHIKLKQRNHLTNETLSHLFHVSYYAVKTLKKIVVKLIKISF